jgi:hypothetical protein
MQGIDMRYYFFFHSIMYFISISPSNDMVVIVLGKIISIDVTYVVNLEGRDYLTSSEL